MDDIRKLTTLEEIKALNDPYRLRILFCFQSNDKPMTVKEIADEMGEVPANVHYHVKKMEKAGILKLSHTKSINGIIAKYYEPTAKDFTISGKSEDSPVMDEVIKHNSKLATIAIFDSSKQIYLDNSDTENKREAFVFSGNVELTEDEVTELRRFLRGIMEKHRNKDEKPDNVKMYHLFTGLVKIKNKK